MTPLALCFLTACLNCCAGEVAYIDRSNESSYSRQQMEAAAKFYGLEIDRIAVSSSQDSAAAVKAIRNPKILAVVITADALSAISQEQALTAMHTNGRHIPLLITGITEQTDPALLRKWSAGAITSCKKSDIEPGTGSYTVGNLKDFTHELSGIKLPLSQDRVSSLTVENDRGAQSIMAALSGGRELAVFVRINLGVNLGVQEVLFATESSPANIPNAPTPYRQSRVFSALAPDMMFLRYAAGERAWHSPGRYANLTIDDAWLRQPYGYVDYEGLLREMEQHNFHTTIAFVPWNFDRNQSATVSLLRAHLDRFSICVHGNNHDHREFGSYDNKPLGGQVQDIKQALARMAKFSELTQLPYDPVMVFPHAIAPEGTLALLKRYNFAATTNFLHEPLGAIAPSDPEFALRPATMEFANFPSLRRYSVEAVIPPPQLAIDAFLGNPMLFYVHQGFFASGIDAFNTTADTVKQLQPGTQWRSLGYIAQHLYLEKLREDGEYDIRLYTGTIHLDNSHKRDATFFVEKEEDFALPVTVLVDGQPYPYQRLGRRLRLQLPVRGEMSREIAIKYKNDLNLASIDISKSSLRIHAIRHLSDFRDNVVSKTGLGRQFIRSYSENGGRWTQAATALTGLLISTIVFWYGRRGKRNSQNRSALRLGHGT